MEEEIKKVENEKSVIAWAAKTKLGKEVSSGKEKDIDKILKSGRKILEPEITESLLTLDSDLLSIGQSKGKFGGGKRRAWKQTQKKTMESNIPSFASMVVVGDRAGHVGLGFGKAKETLPARDKAVRNAKLNVIKITRGFESVEEDKSDPHTIPFKVNGKCGSVRIMLKPAPRGTGLVVADECKKILKLAGIKDVYSATSGKTKTTFNLAKACMDALNKTNEKI
jgi:small subunit ribosomal protein S5